ncbi:dynein regulatory complex subunit 7 [Euwallacea similis]|uniref:dynein regulatory complex subunit 7 n=1 Tax=Euwallacea similis TaxID=1736056 RepID=UPI00344F7BCD
MTEKTIQIPQFSDVVNSSPGSEKTAAKLAKDQEVSNIKEGEERAEGQECAKGENLIENKEHAEGKAAVEQEEKPFSYIEMLDTPIKEFQGPMDITRHHLKIIAEELGLIKLCWPDLSDVTFEDRSNFPETYLRNSDKEKLLLLYTENFRRQICFKYPDRKPLFLACDNECGIQKMVCTTIRPTTLPYSQISSWAESSKFVADHVKFEPLEEPVLIPRHLYSPHTTILRQSGHSFEIATVLCSILVGAGYDAYVVSGYAIKDVTEKIMCRVDCPIPLVKDAKKEEEVVEEDEKYKITPPKDMQSKFLAMMKQRELDKIQAGKEKEAEIKRLRFLEEEKRPPDDLKGRRVHAWIFLAAGTKEVTESIFIEPGTGMPHELTSDLYYGIESIWNNENYWVNLQNCTHDLGALSYDLTDTEKWEHLLIGEPLGSKGKLKAVEIGEEEEIDYFWDEKHLDMPYPWSSRISIPHDVLKRRFPNGTMVTQYKRTLMEEYAPYVCHDGLVQKITRYSDFACTSVECVEEKFKNRHDKLSRSVLDAKTNLKTEYFAAGREDSILKHIYYNNKDGPDAKRTIFLDNKTRFDGLSKIEILDNICTEYYSDRDDKLYFRQVVYEQTRPSTENTKMASTSCKPIFKIVQKFLRNEEKSPHEDISIREFNIREREIALQYQYGKDNVTASTRTFIKPPLAEMGEGMIFRPELTYGYQAEIGAKPPRQLQLYLLLQQQLKDEEEVIVSIRDFENQISDFLLLRAHEMAFSRLDVNVYNREHNQEFRAGMLDQEEKQRICKEKEMEEKIDYLSPYLARTGNPSSLTFQEALDVRQACLEEFKEMLVNRALDTQQQFERMSSKIEDLQAWYMQRHENLTVDEETKYFEEINEMIFCLRTMEIRLVRHKELSYSRYEAMLQYVNNHPMLDILRNYNTKSNNS